MSVFSRTKSSKVRLIIAIIVTLLAGASVYYYLMSVRQTVPAVVATRDIAPNTVINNSDVRIENLSADSKHRLAFSNPKQVIGSMSKETVYKDMQLIAPQIGDEDDNSLKTGETLLPLKNVITSPGLRAGNPVNVNIVRPEGVFSIETRIYQVKNDSEVVIAADNSKAKQIIEIAADAKAIYVLVRR
jgi:hypothetical protein